MIFLTVHSLAFGGLDIATSPKALEPVQELQNSSQPVLVAGMGPSYPSASLYTDNTATIAACHEGKSKEPPAPPHDIDHRYLPQWVQIGHSEGKGIGYRDGYTKFAMVLGPEYEIGTFLPLVQLDVLGFDDGKIAGSVGLLGRYLPKSFCGIFGLDLFYDVRQGRFGTYNQVSGGFEILSRRWELHTMASFVVGEKYHTRTKRFDDYIGPFVMEAKEFEVGVNRVDANAGYYLIYGKYFQTYAAAGPYYLYGKFGASAWGGRAVLRPQYRDIISVELAASYDHIFGMIYEVNAVLSIPLYNFSSALKHKKGPCGIPNRQIYQPVDPIVALRCRCCQKANFD